MDNPIIGTFITATIFSLMFALGVNHSFRQVTYLVRQPGLMARSLLSVIVMVPGIVAVLIWSKHRLKKQQQGYPYDSTTTFGLSLTNVL